MQNKKHFTEWLDENKIFFGSNSHLTERLELNDGTTLSIQAGYDKYCHPRANLDSYKDYKSFEIGFPSVKIDEIMEYAQDPDDPTETVYPVVPKKVIEDLIENRGGIKTDS